jgi:hypothetical protein
LKRQSLVPKIAIILSGLTSFSIFVGIWAPHNAYAVCMRGTLTDTDCDGLADDWEVAKFYDPNRDGKGIPLPAANPNHKNLFVEIDYMVPHSPRSDAIADVVTAFRNAPVFNPDGIAGVTVNVLVDSTTSISHTSCTNIWADFDTIKRAHIGTSSQRIADPANIYSEKKDVYIYSIFIHTQCGNTGSSGTAEIPGNDFVVSLGGPGWGKDALGHPVGSRDQQAGTLMHELGHNLKLQHGGNIAENCKPNYLSVMSYSRQFSYYVSNRLLDYSQSIIPSLDESNLSEPAGIGASTPPGQNTVIGRINQPSPPQTRTVPTGGIPINYDWWIDSDTTDFGIQSSINNLGITTCNSNALTPPLYGFRDWVAIRFWDPSSGGIGNGTLMSASIFGNNNSAALTRTTEVSANDVLSSVNASLTNINNPTVANLSFPGFVSQPCDPSEAACLESACDPADPNRELCTPTNFTSPDPTYDDLHGRNVTLFEVTIDDVRTSRLSLINEIVQNVEAVSDQNFSNPAFANELKSGLVVQLNITGQLLQDDKLQDGIANMIDIRARMDSAFGGTILDDIIVDRSSQEILVPLIDNLVQALQKQL